MSPTTTAGIPLEVHLGPEEWAAIQRADVLAGLTAHPKSLSPTYFYDELGCALFEAITALPEYYPTRTERAILAEHAAAIAHALPADTVVELGSGTSEKTRLLLDAFAAAGRLRRFVAFDVAEPTLRAATAAIASEYPGTAVAGVVGDFRRHLGHLPQEGRRLVAFLGGTIGNLRPAERAGLLATLAGNLRPGEGFLLGTDLVKGPQRLVAAYDDAAGVTAAFNRNILHVLNRELGADFDLAAFDHVARWNAEEEWIEMRLRSRRRQSVRVPGLGITLELADGEEILTEISAKFRPEKVRTELEAAGLHVAESWTDPAGDFALTLGVR
jgi:L-histidine Nalpha-methyltransferase